MKSLLDIFTVTFIGHRYIDRFSFVEEKVEELIRELIATKEYVDFLIGRDGEFDQIAASTILRVKRNVFDANSTLTQAAEEYKYHSFKPKDPDEDAVQLMTVHKAKGLEFHSVFLPELTKREFPVSNMGGKQYWHVLSGTFEENKEKYRGGLEDERKLFYVAVTRAKKNLYMSYELSSQPVSMFVTESASSTFLTINREDLRFNPKADDSDFASIRPSSYASSEGKEEKIDWEEERRRRQEYWATVKYAKSQLYDYYGTGAHFCPAMYSMLGEIKRWSPEQILEEASRNGLI